jgi:hypothetical protein
MIFSSFIPRPTGQLSSTRSSIRRARSCLSREEMSLCPMMMSLKSLNSAPCKGFVKKSAIILRVRQCRTFMPMVSRFSLIQKYCMSKCRDFAPVDVHPFASNLMALSLSCSGIFCKGGYPCSLMNFVIQIVFARYSLTPTSLVCVELFMFTFCFVDLQAKPPRPYEIIPPV